MRRFLEKKMRPRTRAPAEQLHGSLELKLGGLRLCGIEEQASFFRQRCTLFFLLAQHGKESGRTVEES